jgi:hypothetical protein
LLRDTCYVLREKTMLLKNKNKLFFSAIFIVVALFFVITYLQPVLAQTDMQDGLDIVAQETDLGNADLKTIIGRIIKILLGFLGVLAVLLVMYGGFLYMTAGGSEEKVTKAKQVLISAFIGLVIILSAYAIVAFVFDSLLQANDPNGDGNGNGNGNGTTPIVTYGLRSFEVDIIPEGDILIYSFPVKLMFNYPLDADSATNLEDNITIEKITDSGTEVIAGTFSALNENRIVKFVPEQICDDCEDNNCFDKNTEYKVTVTANILKSTQTDREGEKLVLNCSGISNCLSEFTTGAICDRRDPSVVIERPRSNKTICQGAPVPLDVSIFGQDDIALSMIMYQIDLDNAVTWEDFSTAYQVSLGDSPTSYTYSEPWAESSDYDLGSHDLVAAAVDLADHTKIKTKQFNIVPAGCCLETGEIDCASTDPACPSCDGSCRVDSDCVSGVCRDGQCRSWPTIENVVLPSGGPGNLVTIVGSGFSSFKTDVSQLLFSCSSGDGCDEGYIAGEFSCDTAFSWRDDQIIVRVPDISVITGPIKVINRYDVYDDTVNERGWQGDFVYDENLTMPGICAVSEKECLESGDTDCAKGPVSGLVNVSGSGFGTTRGESNIYFDQTISSMQSGGAWADATITNLSIPNLETGYSNVILKAGELCISCPGCIESVDDPACICEPVDTCDDDDDCLCQDIYSNPYRFKIEAPANLPQINSIDPASAPANQLVTIKGVNFGNTPRLVDFIDGELSYTGELSCGDSGWTDNEIIIKVPDDLKLETGTNSVQVRVYNSAGLESAPVAFEINSNDPGPGICQLSPNNGPLNTVFDLFGENFLEDSIYDVVFERGGVTTFLSVEAGYSWLDNEIIGATVPTLALSGNVYLAAEGTTTPASNQVGFRVGRCSNDSCFTGETCCPTGVCVDSVTGCSGQAADFGDTEFSWMVSTGALPKYPKIIERTCDAENNLMASPAPTRNKKTVCMNSTISATFNMMMEWPSFDAETTGTDDTIVKVKLKQCASPDLENKPSPNCDLDACEDSDCITTDYGTMGDLNTLEDNVCITDADGETTCEEVVSRLALEPGLLAGNSWYQVEILGGEYGVEGVKESETDPAYTMPRTYRWAFKTKDEECLPTDIVVTPAQGLIDTVDDKEVYKVSGLKECEILNMGGYDWDWTLPTIADRTKVELFGHFCKVFGTQYEMCPVDGVEFDDEKYTLESIYKDSRKDFGIYRINSDRISNGIVTADIQTDRDDPITVRTTVANVAVEKDSGTVYTTMTQDADLLIDFVDPKIIDYYPKCDSACINSQIQAHFNTKMNGNLLTSQSSIDVYPCTTSECVVVDTGANIEYSSYYNYENDGLGNYVNRLDVNLVSDLSPSTSYRVVVSGNVKSSSGENLSGLNYSTQSGSGDCADRSDNNENGKIDLTGGYDSDDDGDLDFICGCYDTSANTFLSYAKDPTSAKCKELINIEFACQNLSTSSIVLPAELAQIPRTTTYKYYSPDKGCTESTDYEGGESATYDSFSWIFRTKGDDGETARCIIDRIEVDPNDYISRTPGEAVDYVSTPYSAPDSCSATGQALNPYDYNWAWDSSKSEIAEVTHGTYNSDAPAFCNNQCLVVGNDESGLSEADKRCGDGIVEAGEECDKLSNGDANPYCTDTCVWKNFPACSSLKGTYCEEDSTIACIESTLDECTCTVPEYTLKSCCGNGIFEDYDSNGLNDEECEARCTKDGETCDYGEDGCQCELQAGCNTLCLKKGSSEELCGNGAVDPSEDPECDVESGTNGSPYQTATIKSNINDQLSIRQNVCFNREDESCLFDFDYLTLFTEGATAISADTSEIVDGIEVFRTGDTDLIYQTAECLLPPVAIHESKPANNVDDVCTNALIKTTFSGRVNPVSLNRDTIKLTKKIDGNGFCPVTLPMAVSRFGFDEGQGTVAHDSVNNINGQITSGIFIDGRIGKALEFNGDDSAVSVPINTFADDKHWTISSWVFIKPSANERHTIFEIDSSDDAERDKFWLDAQGTNTYISTYVGSPSASNQRQINEPLPTDSWFHLTVTYNGSDVTIYKDGQWFAMKTVPILSSFDKFNRLWIGNKGSSGVSSLGLNGAIDEFVIFDQALSADEINRIYSDYLGDDMSLNQFDYKFAKNPLKATKQFVVNSFQGIKETVRGLLIKTGWAVEPKVCDVGFNFAIEENSLGKTVVSVIPHTILDGDTDYTLEFTDISNSCGKQSSETINFKTGAELCKVNNVLVKEADLFVIKPDITEPYKATAKHYDQEIHAIDDIYAWTWDWESLDSSLAKVNSSAGDIDPNETTVTTFNKNGQTSIEATATVTVDNSGQGGDTTGASTTGYGNLEIFICNELWNPTLYPHGEFDRYGTDRGFLTHLYHTVYNIGVFYCRDAGQPILKSCYDGRACYNDDDCSGIGDGVCSSPEVCSDGITSCNDDTDCSGIGTGKCLMVGAHDDLPNLKVTEATLQSSFSFSDPTYAVKFDGDMDYLEIDRSSLSEIDFATGHYMISFDLIVDESTDHSGLIMHIPFSDDGSLYEKNLQLFTIFENGNSYLGYSISSDSTYLAKRTKLPIGFDKNSIQFEYDEGTITLMIEGASLSNYNMENLSFSDRFFSDRALRNEIFIGGVEGKPAKSFLGAIGSLRFLDKTEAPFNTVARWTFENDFIDEISQLEFTKHGDVSRVDYSDPQGVYQSGVASGSVLNQCQDGLDNDLNGLSDFADPKCSDPNDNWESPALLSQYFFGRDADYSNDSNKNNDDSSDIIALRIYENPEALAPELWYMKYAPNPKNISSIDIDCIENSAGKFCYQGGKEGSSVYIAAGNLDDPTLYNNIYLLGYNDNANPATQNIFTQMTEMIKFNINVLAGSGGITEKQIIMKDIRRVQDISLIHQLIDGYKFMNSGKVPQLESGTYVRGETFSVWPSWQRVFGEMLGGALPVDSDNHFVWEQAAAYDTTRGELCQDLSSEGSDELYCEGENQCVIPGEWCSTCPTTAIRTYDKYTCYSSDVTGENLPEFYSPVSDNINKNPVYQYKATDSDSYEINFSLEGYNRGDADGYNYYDVFKVVPKRNTVTGEICVTSGAPCDYIYK